MPRLRGCTGGRGHTAPAMLQHAWRLWRAPQPPWSPLGVLAVATSAPVCWRLRLVSFRLRLETRRPVEEGFVNRRLQAGHC